MRDHCFRSIKYTELIGKKNAQYSNTGRSNHPKAAKKEAQRASTGNGRRPHPRFLSKRLRFCPAAIRKASQLTRQSRRKRMHRKPCQSLASPDQGSTLTFILFIALFYAFV